MTPSKTLLIEGLIYKERRHKKKRLKKRTKLYQNKLQDHELLSIFHQSFIISSSKAIMNYIIMLKASTYWNSIRSSPKDLQTFIFFTWNKANCKPHSKNRKSSNQKNILFVKNILNGDCSYILSLIKLIFVALFFLSYFLKSKFVCTRWSY